MLPVSARDRDRTHRSGCYRALVVAVAVMTHAIFAAQFDGLPVIRSGISTKDRIEIFWKYVSVFADHNTI